MRIYDNGVYRDMTPEEMMDWEKAQNIETTIEELTNEEITEILAEQEYRICLLELGVTENDLQTM